MDSISRCAGWAAGFVLVLTAWGPVRAEPPGPAPARFYRGLSLNGPSATIDGHPWDGSDGSNCVCNGQRFENQNVPLVPACDAARARMIRGSRWGANIEVALTNVPAGVYQVYLYVWEDNVPTHFRISLNDQVVVADYDSRGAGNWAKLGPWKANVADGRLAISARGGDANLSGIEVWSGDGPIPEAPPGPGSGPAPSSEQLAFFESRIRPLLADHCYQCHSAGAKKLGGNLLLDSRAGIARGGDTEPPIVPGDAGASLLMTAVRYNDPALKMPPKTRLTAAQVADLETWITMGAADPRDQPAAAQPKYAIDWDRARDWWAFRPVRPVQPPTVRNDAWPRNDIDRFILARLERESMTPAADAGRSTLLRRASYDLVGLPPTPEQIDAFVNDPAPDAFARVVDRLLASPQYGERWGRHWLDVVRYADTAGDNSDFPIPQMYRYRNWVIAAINRDMPYDQFVRTQLAGDLLPARDDAQKNEQIIATGYIANARRFGSRVSDYPQHLTIEDTIDNLGRTFLGLTINCARCHDHKFDPIASADYYGLYGIFQSTRYPWPGIELEQHQRDLVPLVAAGRAAAALKAKNDRQDQLDAEVRRIEKERDAAQGAARAKRDKAVEHARKAAEDWARTPLAIEQAYAVADAPKVEDAFVQIKGDPNKRGSLVRRRFLNVLGGAPVPDGERTSGRLRLAGWVADSQNPLTARVMANRIWLYHFGRGIVPTPNDFGRQGRAPSHSELLDWLAQRFIDSGWSIKALHRTIMLSRTYQLAGRHDGGANAELLAAYPRRRLDAESIRDTLLTLGGNLDPKPGGPHPFPPQTDWRFTQHNPFKAVYETNQRSVYLMTQRIQRHPYLAIFDGADPSASTPLRIASTTPLQALYLLNDPFVHDQARRFAARLLAQDRDDRSRIDRASLLTFGRHAAPDEADRGTAFLDAVRQELHSAGSAPDQVDLRAWQALARVLFRMNEFVYID